VKAVVLRETGRPDRLELTEVPDPEPADGEVVVRVRAAGVNFADVLVRQGRYPQPPELPTVPGSPARSTGGA
jgi:NADPH:quinone reductase-like Zn-dependent oxidoreductase